MTALERAYRKLLRSKLNTQQALDAIAEDARENGLVEDVQFLVDFVESSQRGVIKMKRRGSRGAS